ncbi:YoaK family protein [Alloscardovia macacae]|nr:YoaK family protein [Alloscardovia macacae]
MPQDTRFAAVLLAFLGGALDVFCHIRFKTLLATQTGNIILLISDLKPDSWQMMLIKCLSIAFFSLGFVLGIWAKRRARTAYWRVWLLLPLLFCTAIFPLFLHASSTLSVALLGFGTGLMMLTFTGSHIEAYPFTILMTSGNYRRMLTAWYDYFSGEREFAVLRRALSYVTVVVSFICGGLGVSVLERVVGDYALWVVTVALMILLVYYCAAVYVDALEERDV